MNLLSEFQAMQKPEDDTAVVHMNLEKDVFSKLNININD